MHTGFKKLVLGLSVALPLALPGGGAGAYVVVSPHQPTLADVFDGTARFQTIGESQEVTLDMDVDGQGRQQLWDQKMPVLFDAETGEYYTFTRGFAEETRKFRIAVLTSRDGIDFTQKGILFPELHADPADKWTLYDAHVSFDGERYILATECANREIGPSLCLSETRTPFDLESWSRPVPIVKNSPAERQSASTGAALTHRGDTYVTWTVVNDGGTANARMVDGAKVLNDDDGTESTFSKAIRLPEDIDGNILYAGQSINIGTTIAATDANPYCTRSWDCNNIDIQDWKVEDDKVYAIYNGSNYYRCFRPDRDAARSNRWGIGIRRADSPLGDYSESSGIVIDSAVDDICGISYPVLNTIAGETFLYYSYYAYGLKGERINRAMRSRLIHGSPLAVTLQTRSQARSPAGTGRVGRLVSGDVDDDLGEGIRRLYVKILGRYPRNAEVDDFRDLARREGYEAVVRAVVLSKEHRRVWASRDTDRKIEALYQGIFDRAPDPAGFDGMLDMIVGQDAPLPAIFRIFADSPEFRADPLVGR